MGTATLLGQVLSIVLIISGIASILWMKYRSDQYLLQLFKAIQRENREWLQQQFDTLRADLRQTEWERTRKPQP
jgi:hypothetical protein